MKAAPQQFAVEDLRKDWPETALHEDFAATQERVLRRPPAPRGIRTLHTRVRLAWRVFTGRADALVWRGQ